MDINQLFPLALAILIISALSYGLGRRAGIVEGRKREAAIAPLRLRQRSLTLGRCPVCFRSEQEYQAGTENYQDGNE